MSRLWSHDRLIAWHNSCNTTEYVLLPFKLDLANEMTYYLWRTFVQTYSLLCKPSCIVSAVPIILFLQQLIFYIWIIHFILCHNVLISKDPRQIGYLCGHYCNNLYNYNCNHINQIYSGTCSRVFNGEPVDQHRLINLYNFHAIITI